MKPAIFFMTGAICEAIFAGVSLFQGDGERFRWCLVMAMLNIIAAGVWRERK